MYQKYKDQAGFLLVYILEAHPADGWQLDSNEEDDVIFNRATSWSKRKSVASKCATKLNLSMPVAVDAMDNTVDKLYAAWPERLFVVDADMTVAYTAKQGPWGFKPQDAEKALKKLLRRN